MSLEFERFDERLAEGIKKSEQPSVAGWLGVRVTEVTPGRMVAEVPIRPELLTHIGNLHGGVIAALVDHVLGTVMYPLMERGAWAATTEFKLNYLAPVKEGTLVAEATVVSMTKRTAVVTIEVRNGARLACVAQGTCLLQQPR